VESGKRRQSEEGGREKVRKGAKESKRRRDLRYNIS